MFKWDFTKIKYSGDSLEIFKIEDAKYIKIDNILCQLLKYDPIIIILESLKPFFDIEKRGYHILKYSNKKYIISKVDHKDDEINEFPLSGYTIDDLDDEEILELRKLIAFYEIFGVRKINEKNIYIHLNNKNKLYPFLIKEYSTSSIYSPNTSTLDHHLLKKWLKRTNILYYIKLVIKNYSKNEIREIIDDIYESNNLKDNEKCILYYNYIIARLSAFS